MARSEPGARVDPATWWLCWGFFLLLSAGCSGKGVEPPQTGQSELTALVVQDVTPGTGAEAGPGKTVQVHYTGWLFHPTNTDHKGTQFDTSRSRGEAFTFVLGAGEVIPGWEQGLAGMRQGGARRVTIPPALAYGARGAGDLIPPNATLVFDIELLEVR